MRDFDSDAPVNSPAPRPAANIIGVALLCLLSFAAGVGGTLVAQRVSWPSVGPPAKSALIVILYESANGEPPAYAAGAANELRKAGREVRFEDDDVANGLNAVPTEVAAAIEPGRKIMGGTDGKGFALVLVSGGKVVKAIELPKSKEAIVEACK